MRRREFLKRSGMALASASLAKSAAGMKKPSAKPFNLLLVTADDMNYSMAGWMGNPDNLTPSIDHFSKRCHRFVHNRTTAPICQPSREAMMTGLVPHRSGALGFDPIKEGTPTLTTILKAENYYTVGLHKIEHMQPPSCFPWDEVVEGEGRDPLQHGETVAQAIRKARELKRPFFINCNITDPHRPFYGTSQAAEKDHNETQQFEVPNERSADQVHVPSFLEDLPEIRQEIAQYSNSTQRMDISFGRIMDAIRATPEMDNTIILFTSDHGMPFPFSKATVYTNGTRTPVLISWPGMGSPRAFEEFTSNIDILPTLLDLLRLTIPSGIDGRSWLPLMQGRSQNDRDHVITHVNELVTGAVYPMRAIENRQFALIFAPWSDGQLRFKTESMTGLTFNALVKAAESDPRTAERVKQYIYGTPLALYDSVNDPAQRHNLIHEPEHKAVADRLQQRLLAYMERTGDPQFDNFKAVLAGGKATVKQPEKLRFQNYRYQ